MTIITKTVGRLPVNLGDYDSSRSYGKKNRVILYSCEWESKIDNNTYPPATLTDGEIIPDTDHWFKVSGSWETWLIDQGIKKVETVHVKDTTLNKTQDVFNAEVNEFVGEKEYSDEDFSGQGRVYLRKNLVNIAGEGEEENIVNLLTQDMFMKEDGETPNENCVFVIQYKYIIGEDITLPDNCTIEYDGGKITTDESGYKLSGAATIINRPESMFGDMDCRALDIVNIPHFSASDLIDTKPTTNLTRLQFRNFVGHIRSISKMYDVAHLSQLYTVCTYDGSVAIRFVFFNADRIYMSQTGYLSNYYNVPVPSGAVYVAILISSVQLWVANTFNEAIPKIYSNFTENAFVEINLNELRDGNGLLNSGDLYWDLTDRTYAEIVYNSDFSNYKKFYKYSSNSITAACIPYSVLRLFDYLEINPGAESTYIHFLTQEPLEDGEDAVYSTTYQGPYRVFGNSNSGTITLPIPSDTKYIMICLKYHTNEALTTIVDGTPTSAHLRHAENLGVLCSVSAQDNDYNNFRSLTKNFTRRSLSFIHWNVGNFGNGDYKTHIDENNYAAKKDSFNRFFNKYYSHNIFFNEFNPVFAVVNGSNKSGWEAVGTTYCIRKVMPRFSLYDNLAFNALLGLGGWSFGRLSSYDGKLKSDNNKYSPIAYCIYQYSLGNSMLALIHVHLGTHMTSTTITAVMNELKSIGSNYSTCIIFGDFNISDISSLSILTNAGYSVGNQLDLDGDNIKPTYPGTNKTLDWVLYKGNITLSEFKVCTDAVDYGYSDGDTDHMLSDHWPIRFTVTINSVPKIENIGEMYFDTTLGKPIWWNGTDWVDASGSSVS